MKNTLIVIGIFVLIVFLSKIRKEIIKYTVQELSLKWNSGAGMPTSTEDSEIAKKLKSLGYCAGFGGRGAVAQRYVCKIGTTDLFGDKCNC